MPDNPIHAVVVEEHHEAFYVWRYAREHGWIPTERPLALLHVDEHADMCLPVLKRPLRDWHSLAEVARFTYGNLGINNFICPAIYQGLFDRVYWLRIQHSPTAGGWRRMWIAANSQEERTFSKVISTRLEPPSSDDRSVEYAPITITDLLPQGLSCILDIDLDYFCWNDYPELPELELEITEDAYAELQGDPYHFLRLSQNGRVSAFRRDGRTLLSFADPDPPQPVVTPFDKVLQRVEDFVAYLVRHSVDPRLAVICRSRHSGYVQSAHVDGVQDLLLRRLDQIFGLETHSIDELLAGQFHPTDVFDRKRPIRLDEEEALHA